MLDSKPYKLFKDLKQKYPVKTILIKDSDIGGAGLSIGFKNHREYIAHLFKQQGVVVTRWSHDYNSIDTSEPKLGLVYLVNDSIIVPGMEVHALIGHNARYLHDAAGN